MVVVPYYKYIFYLGLLQDTFCDFIAETVYSAYVLFLYKNVIKMQSYFFLIDFLFFTFAPVQKRLLQKLYYSFLFY